MRRHVLDSPLLVLPPSAAPTQVRAETLTEDPWPPGSLPEASAGFGRGRVSHQSVGQAPP